MFSQIKNNKPESLGTSFKFLYPFGGLKWNDLSQNKPAVLATATVMTKPSLSPKWLEEQVASFG